MIRLLPVFALVLLLSCQSKQDKMLKELGMVESYLQPLRNFDLKMDSMAKKMGGRLDPDKLSEPIRADLRAEKREAMNKLYAIPDSMGRKMHDFAVAYPQHAKSEEYLYRATQLAERQNRYFETARWCETYVKNYPKGKHVFDAIVAAAFNFEQSGTYNKAIEYYEKIVKEYPNSKIAADAKNTVKMLKMGLLTEQQQLDYLMQQAKDSSGKSH